MLHHQHRHAQLVLDVGNPEGHVLCLLNVQTAGGLVEQQQFGLGAQRTRHFNDFAHAVGQARHVQVAVMLKIEQLDDFLSLFAGFQLGCAGFACEHQVLPKSRRAMGVAANQQVVQYRGIFKQLNVLKRACNAQRSDVVRRLVGQLGATVNDFTGGRRVDAADQVEHRRFARAVGANQREHFALVDVKAHIVDGQHPAEAHAQIFGRQEDFGHGNCRRAGPTQARQHPRQRITRKDKRGGIISNDQTFGMISAA